MARYELSEGTSNKFWDITLAETSFTTTYGRIGTAGQSTTKTFDTAAKARAEHDKLVAEKVRKGYAPVAGGAVATSPAAPRPAAARPPAAAAATPSPAPTPASSPSPSPSPSQPAAEAAQPAAPPVAEVASPTAEPLDAPTRPTMRWTPRLTALAEEQRAALAVEPRLREDARATHGSIHARFMQGAKERIEQGLVQLGARTAITKEVIRVYASEALPTANDPAVEGAALLLLPHGLRRPGGPDVVIPESDVLRGLVARGGAALALQAFAASLGPLAPWSSQPPPATSLVEKEYRKLVELLGERMDA